MADLIKDLANGLAVLAIIASITVLAVALAPGL